MDENIKRAIDFCKNNAKNDIQKACSAHIIFSYQTLSEAIKFKLPVIDYKKLVSEKNESVLYSYLRNKIPEALLSRSLTKSVINTAIDCCLSREKMYRNLNVEHFCLRLIEQLEGTHKFTSHLELLY